MKTRYFLLPSTLVAILACGATATAQVPLPAGCGGPIGLTVQDVSGNWTGNIFIAPPRYAGGDNFAGYADGDWAAAYAFCNAQTGPASVAIWQSYGASYGRTGGPGGVTLNSNLCAIAAAQANGIASASTVGAVQLTSSLLPAPVLVTAAVTATTGPVVSNVNSLVVNVASLGVLNFSVGHFAYAAVNVSCDDGVAFGNGGGTIFTTVILN